MVLSVATHDKEYEDLKKLAEKENTLVARHPRHPNQVLSLVLPLAPSVNDAYMAVRRGRGVRIIRKKATKNYIDAVKLKAKQAIYQQKYKVEPEGVWLCMNITFYMPDRRQRDGHNMHKVLADALEGVAYHNDRWVIIRDIDVLYDKKNPRLEIEISCQEKQYQVLKKK